YGAYVEDVLGRAGARAWGRFRRVRGEAVACRPSAEGWEIAFAKHKPIACDAVVLAMGNGESVTPPVFETNDVPGIGAWDPEAVRRVRRGGNVLMIGVGLTMIDIALTLACDARMGAIFALSRRGLLPRAHLTNPAPVSSEAPVLPSELSQALHLFRREV